MRGADLVARNQLALGLDISASSQAIWSGMGNHLPLRKSWQRSQSKAKSANTYFRNLTITCFYVRISGSPYPVQLF
jgi:hypothetical protein